jgi:hypothetical protein
LHTRSDVGVEFGGASEAESKVLKE